MKKMVLIIMIFPVMIFGQMKLEDKIKMTTVYGSKNQELQDILTFESIDYFKVQFTGKELKGKHFSLVVKKIWDGEIREIDTIIKINKIDGISLIESDTLNFKVTGKKITENKLKVFFRFDRFANVRLFEATDSFDYSLRGVGTQMDIEPGKSFPAMAYILPYEKDGGKYWCAVDKSGKDVESWGREFGIKHYLIFEMKFE